MKTSDNFSPWDLLPLPAPSTEWPAEDFFYENVSKHLIKDVIRITGNGIPIDLDKVSALEATLDDVLADVATRLHTNPLIYEFQLNQHKRLVEDYKAEQASKMKDYTHFLKPFDSSKMEHRSYFMHCYTQDHPLEPPDAELPTGLPKWTVRDVKSLPPKVIFTRLLSGELADSNKYVKQSMRLLAEHKADLYNRRFNYQANIDNAHSLPIPPFNPASAPQKQALFEWLNIPSEKTSKDTGLPSWDRDEVERINRETDNDNIRDLTQAFIDFSFGAIIKNNFIKAFYDYTIDNRLYGGMKLFGTKTLT